MSSVESLPTNLRHVVAMSYPGRGHVCPMMSLCKSLVSRADDILITFVVTEEWLGFIGASEPERYRIRLVAIPDVLPSELARAADFRGFIKAVMTKMEAPFELLLDRLDPPPSLIIADTFLPWAVRVGSRRNIPVASFWPMSAAMFTTIQHFHLLERNGHFPVDLSERGNERVDYIPGLSSTSLVDILGTSGGHYNYVLETFLEAFSCVPKAQYLLLTSLHELEQAAVDALKSEFVIPIYTIGPSLRCFELGNNSLNSDKPEIFQWLDSQPKDSVLYVSFGSFLSVTSNQMDEIVAGLLDSGVSFMLVARSETDRLKDQALPCKGLVVPWCDQLRVLSHKSIGGFLSHCGWNSTKEGILSGVPFLTFPITADQFLNGKLIVEDWNIGWRITKDMRKDCLVKREEIAGIVKKFMDGEEGDTKEMRERAKEFQEMLRRGVRRDGSSESNIASFINGISSSSM